MAPTPDRRFKTTMAIKLAAYYCAKSQGLLLLRNYGGALVVLRDCLVPALATMAVETGDAAVVDRLLVEGDGLTRDLQRTLTQLAATPRSHRIKANLQPLAQARRLLERLFNEDSPLTEDQLAGLIESLHALVTIEGPEPDVKKEAKAWTESRS